MSYIETLITFKYLIVQTYNSSSSSIVLKYLQLYLQI